MKNKTEYYFLGITAVTVALLLYKKKDAIGKKVDEIEFFTLRNGVKVLAKTTKKYGLQPIQYANNTQATQKVLVLLALGYNAFVWSSPGNDRVKYIRIDETAGISGLHFFNGKEYRLRKNTEGATKKQLEELARYGKEKGHITSYRIVKEDGRHKLYIY